MYRKSNKCNRSIEKGSWNWTFLRVFQWENYLVLCPLLRRINGPVVNSMWHKQFKDRNQFYLALCFAFSKCQGTYWISGNNISGHTQRGWNRKLGSSLCMSQWTRDWLDWQSWQLTNPLVRCVVIGWYWYCEKYRANDWTRKINFSLLNMQKVNFNLLVKLVKCYY